MTTMRNFAPAHFDWRWDAGIATVSLHGAARKNPLTFESYAELRDMFRELAYADDVDVVVLTSNDGNFCSGGDVHDIIGPLLEMDMKGIFAFTRMTGDLVKAMLACGKPVIAAVDGICVGAGAILAMAADMRLATPEAKVAFLFTRVGLAGCDMGACAMLPRSSVRARRRTSLHRKDPSGRRGTVLGILECRSPGRRHRQGRRTLAERVSSGPNFAHMMTKTQLNQEWAMSLETAIESEAQAQAICMQTEDFRRAYRAFVAKEKPVFEGD